MVSVITSAYNCENYISEMIDSILAQTYSDWELILIDDASTDQTWNKILKYTDSRIRKIRNEKNEGLTKNLNKGIRMARGKYIIRIDADDIAFSRRIEKQVQYMENHSDVVLSGCWVKVFGDKSDVWRNNLDSDRLNIHLLFGAVIFHPTFIIRKSILDEKQLYYDEKLKYAQDYNLEYRISKYGRLANIPEVLMKYRVHNKQISTEKLVEQTKCANYTRGMILHELNIILTEQESLIWQKFGLLKSHFMDKCEREILVSIIEKIVNENKRKEIYKQDMLQSILSRRFQFYIEQCKNATISSSKQIGIEPDEKYYRMFQLMIYWKKNLKKRNGIANYLKKRNIQEVAVYGLGYLGEVLIDDLIDASIQVAYAIDKASFNNFVGENIKIYSPDEVLPKVDMVIVTPLSGVDAIRKNLSEKMDCNIISIEEMIYEAAQY